MFYNKAFRSGRFFENERMSGKRNGIHSWDILDGYVFMAISSYLLPLLPNCYYIKYYHFAKGQVDFCCFFGIMSWKLNYFTDLDKLNKILLACIARL